MCSFLYKRCKIDITGKIVDNFPVIYIKYKFSVTWGSGCSAMCLCAVFFLLKQKFWVEFDTFNAET